MPNIDRPLWQLLLDLKTAVRGERPFSCTECFTILEYLAESLSQDQDISVERQKLLREAVRQHLTVCPNCQTHYLERLDELERLLKQQSQSTTSQEI